MNRFMYIGMSHANNNMASQAIRANNLANINTVGFKADFEQLRSVPLVGDGLPTRAYALTERPGFRPAPGSLDQTGRDLDVAIVNHGWFVVETDEGEAMTRDGQFSVDADGVLRTSSGHQVMGEEGPIVLPPYSSVQVSQAGDIQIFGGGNPTGQGITVDRLKLVDPDSKTLFKDKTGLIRTQNNEPLVTSQTVKIQSGALERSNVNAVDEMVGIIAAARGYELSIKMLSEAKAMDESANSLLRAM